MIKTNIDEAIARVDDWKGKKVTYEPVAGGITNPNFKVNVEGTNYFLKIPGAGTDFINRDVCHAANVNAAESGAGPKVCYYYEDTGVEIFEWLEGYRQVTYGDVYDEHIFTMIAEASAAFHNRPGSSLPLVESVFDQTRDMVERAKQGRFLPPWHDRMLYMMDVCEEAFNIYGIENKVCHNDLYTNNMMYNDETGDLKIIDWEYASMNDPYYDLGTFSDSNFLTEPMDVELTKIYHGGKFDDIGFARLKLNKILSDIKWGYWSLQQAINSDVDFDYMNWYNIQTCPLPWKWSDPRLDSWINMLKGRTPFYTE